MNIRRLEKIFKTNDGGTIKFKDRYRRKTYYFDIYYESSVLAFKKIKKNSEFILLLSSDENHQLFETIENVQDYLGYSKQIKVGSIINLDLTYAIADKELTIELFTNIMIPDQFEKYLSNEPPVFENYPSNYSNNHEEPKLSKAKPKNTYSIFSTNKPNPKPRFDWHDHYLEGLRIHGNIDDAESHADDEEYKYKKRNK